MRILLIRLLCVTVLFCAGVTSVAAASQVTQIILLQDETSTKAFVEISQQSAYKAFLLKSPDRAVLDIDGAEFAPQFKLPGANGVVLSVRQGKTPTGLRLVFDLAQGARLSDRIDLSGGKPRLVLELDRGGLPIAAKTETVATKAEPPPKSDPEPVPYRNPTQTAAGCPATR